MKNFKLITSLAISLSFLLVSSISAQEIKPLNLQNNMKQSGIALKQIVATINDATKNVDNAALTEKIIGYFQTAKTQSPDSVTNGSLADYQNLIEQEIQNLKNLKAALVANDNVTALSIVQKINNIKKEGHDKYK